MMAKKNLANIATSVFLIMALMVTGIAVKRTVDMRRRAAEAGAKFYFDSASFSMVDGETKEVKFFIDTGIGESLTFAAAQICYSDNLKIGNTTTDIYLPKSDPYFAELAFVRSSTLPEGMKCAEIIGSTKMKALGELKYGVIEIANIKFTAIAAGTAKIVFGKDPLKTYLTTKVSVMGANRPIGEYKETVVEVAPKAGNKEAQISLDPKGISSKVGGTGEIIVKVNSTREVNAVNVNLCYGKGIKIADKSKDITIAGTGSAGLASVDSVVIKQNADGSTCANIYSLASYQSKDIKLPIGAFDLFRIKFTGVTLGKEEVKLDETETELGGVHDDAKGIRSEVTYSVTNGITTYDIVPDGVTATVTPPTATVTPPTATLTPVPTEAPITDGVVMKFNMTFGDVMAEGDCAKKNWTTVKVKLTDSQGNTAQDLVAKVTATEKFEKVGVNSLRIYKVVAKFPNFQPKGNVFALIGGPVHMYEKYGKDGQEAEYKEYIGKLTGLTNDVITTKEFNFTKYPLGAGDVTSEKQAGILDNKMNALDYAYIKNAYSDWKNPEVIKKVDLNGDCVLGSPDAVIFTNNLNEKNGKEY